MPVRNRSALLGLVHIALKTVLYGRWEGLKIFAIGSRNNFICCCPWFAHVKVRATTLTKQIKTSSYNGVTEKSRIIATGSPTGSAQRFGGGNQGICSSAGRGGAQAVLTQVPGAAACSR